MFYDIMHAVRIIILADKNKRQVKVFPGRVVSPHTLTLKEILYIADRISHALGELYRYEEPHGSYGNS